MANFTVHLAIAQEWARLHNKFYSDDFMYGAVAPDLLAKINNLQGNFHYGIATKDMPIELQYKNKVDLHKYVMQNDINSDYDLGYFLHLVVDYYFFNVFLDLDKIAKLPFNFKQALYENYDATLPYVNSKYNVKYDCSYKELEYVKDRYANFVGGNFRCLLYDNAKLSQFIEDMAHIDLFELYETIKNGNSKEISYVR